MTKGRGRSLNLNWYIKMFQFSGCYLSLPFVVTFSTKVLYLTCGGTPFHPSSETGTLWVLSMSLLDSSDKRILFERDTFYDGRRWEHQNRQGNTRPSSHLCLVPWHSKVDSACGVFFLCTSYLCVLYTTEFVCFCTSRCHYVWCLLLLCLRHPVGCMGWTGVRSVYWLQNVFSRAVGTPGVVFVVAQCPQWKVKTVFSLFFVSFTYP